MQFRSLNLIVPNFVWIMHDWINCYVVFNGVDSGGGAWVAIALPIKNTGVRVSFRPLQISAVFWALICPECVCGRGLCPGLRLESLQRPHSDSLAGARGLTAPAQVPHPLSAFSLPCLALRASGTHASETVGCVLIKFRPLKTDLDWRPWSYCRPLLIVTFLRLSPCIDINQPKTSTRSLLFSTLVLLVEVSIR